MSVANARGIQMRESPFVRYNFNGANFWLFEKDNFANLNTYSRAPQGASAPRY